MQPSVRNTRKKSNLLDYKLLGIILALLIVGLIILFSASAVLSYNAYKNNTHYFFHQLIFGTLIGLVLMYVLSKIDYHIWQKLTPILILASIILLVAVLVPGIGYKSGGSRRWIGLGPITVQPEEIVKLALIFYIASWIDKRSHEIRDFYYGIIPTLLIIGLVAGLIILEPDIGTMLVVTLIGLTMLFVGGSQIKHLGWILAMGLGAFAIIVKVEPYRVARFTAFLNPSVDPKGIGYQINQALLAIGSGGVWGYGYGHSRQKYNYLPEVMGDSIFAVTVEELGFFRSLLIIGLYGAFAWRGFKIANNAPDTFGKMVAVGIVAWITFQAFINIGAIIGLLPLTGIPLPFISYGSSSLIVILAAMGILLNISKQAAV